MCIRDSVWEAMKAQAQAAEHAPSAPVFGSDVAHRMVDFAPVSYTHLRAHETVLDLVCRLLLEKKKDIVTKTPT